MLTLGFGGGCHWCTEAVFQPLVGVAEVRQGFIASDPPDEGWSEAVEVSFDPARVSLADLIGVHLATHASAANHRMRGKYRSAVYAPDTVLQARCAGLITQVEAETGCVVVTRALMHRGFRPSDERFHNYYRSDPERPFCQAHIAPKLSGLRARYGALLDRADDPS